MPKITKTNAISKINHVRTAREHYPSITEMMDSIEEYVNKQDGEIIDYNDLMNFAMTFDSHKLGGSAMIRSKTITFFRNEIRPLRVK